MRLIDADALIETINESIKNRRSPYTRAITMMLCNAPTIEAVPVVRCKDCKHIDESWSEDGYAWCKRLGWKKYDYYCADGERRTE